MTKDYDLNEILDKNYLLAIYQNLLEVPSVRNYKIPRQVDYKKKENYFHKSSDGQVIFFILNDFSDVLSDEFLEKSLIAAQSERKPRS